MSQTIKSEIKELIFTVSLVLPKSKLTSAHLVNLAKEKSLTKIERMTVMKCNIQITTFTQLL